MAKHAPPRTITVLRALQFGDLMCAVPTLRALRHRYPEAHISLVGLPWAKEFQHRFRHYLDQLIEFPGYPGIPERTSETSRIPDFLWEMQRAQYDLVVQLHGSGRITNSLALLFGGARCVGFYEAGTAPPVHGEFIEYRENLSETERLLEILPLLDAQPRGRHYEWPLLQRDCEEFLAADRQWRLTDRPFVCVHPGARDPTRRWGAGRFALLARQCIEHGFTVALTGSRYELSLCQAIAKALGDGCVGTAGQTSLGSLAVLIGRAKLLISNDTGISHLAAALGTPSLITFTASDPMRWAPADRVRHRVIDARRHSKLTEAQRTLAEILRGEAAHAA